MPVIDPNLIKVGVESPDKKTCLTEIAEMFHREDVLVEGDDYLNVVLERERILSTGIGKGIGIPHGRSGSVRRLQAAVCILKNAIEFDSMDGEPVRIVIMIAIPPDTAGAYMMLLSKISRFLGVEDHRNRLLAATNEQEVYEILKGLNDA